MFSVMLLKLLYTSTEAFTIIFDDYPFKSGTPNLIKRLFIMVGLKIVQIAVSTRSTVKKSKTPKCDPIP
jgi:hypothetical protein